MQFIPYFIWKWFFKVNLWTWKWFSWIEVTLKEHIVIKKKKWNAKELESVVFCSLLWSCMYWEWANISAKDNTALSSTYWLIKQVWERERESCGLKFFLLSCLAYCLCTYWLTSDSNYCNISLIYFIYKNIYWL